jgi:hypothetical protein
MPKYKVLINDNAHFMDESERADHGVFADADEATRPIPKEIGRVIRRFVVLVFHVPSFRTLAAGVCATRPPRPASYFGMDSKMVAEQAALAMKRDKSVDLLATGRDTFKPERPEHPDDFDCCHWRDYWCASERQILALGLQSFLPFLLPQDRLRLDAGMLHNSADIRGDFLCEAWQAAEVGPPLS